MNANVGKCDRAFRLVFGIVIVALGLHYESYWGFVGIVPIATAFMRWCPVYLPLKISTIEKKV